MMKRKRWLVGGSGVSDNARDLSLTREFPGGFEVPSKATVEDDGNMKQCAVDHPTTVLQFFFASQVSHCK
jgi:hypothetical protein